ncbi:hypothetical protein QKW35_20610 [Pontibacterium granulatum]|uniref:hypothetical protein n=1 Tax=Pontibacterium granulatum TaxID=2036029 RepID=UPI00249AAD9F|nr:hypothetical protein [Pontibacterium granulatum]MDI3326786.1 hypothetical protein [Pontibacterium granulatum]
MANLWKQFESLIDKDVTQLATITATNGTTSTVQLLSGDTLKVTGTGTPGSKVFIKGGEIKQAAPNLTEHTMTLY